MHALIVMHADSSRTRHREMLVVKPRDVMPQHARTLPAALLRRSRRTSSARWSSCSRGCGSARDGPNRSTHPGQFFVRELLGEQHHRHARRRRAVNAFYNVCRHRGTRAVHGAAGRVSPAASSARITPGPTTSTGGCSARRTWTKCRTSARTTIRCIASHADVWDGHIFLNLDAQRRRRSTRSSATLPGKFRPWRMEDLRLGHRIVYDVKANWKLIVQNYNECLHCPNLHPALNKLSHYLSGENEPLQRDLHGRTDGSAARRRHAVDGRDLSARVPARTVAPRIGGASTTTRSFRTCCSACTPTTCWCTRSGRSRRTARSTSASGTSSPRSCARPGSTPIDAVEFWDMTNRQDWHVCELSQAGICVARLHARARTRTARTCSMRSTR